ncbi:MAG: FAD-binding oxidoreductase [Elainellaceae cyanobacterium]
MTTYDWIVVGNGIVGASVSYELAKVGFSVLLLDRFPEIQNATRYSYGGVAYWSGTTALSRQLCQEGIERHRLLSAELEADTQFREVDLLLTIDRDHDPSQAAATYAQCLIPPSILSPETAHEMEPLLNPAAIAGTLHFRHGHVSPEASVRAYNQAFLRVGGTIEIATVTGLVQSGHRVSGVTTTLGQHESDRVLLCTGGMSRTLLNSFGLSARVYFTQAELIETPPAEIRLNTIVMPANLKRFALEAEAGAADMDSLWSEPGHEVTTAILDAGVVQFQDGRLRMGQVSRTLTDPNASADPNVSEKLMRQAIGNILPTLQNLPGQWHSCLVAFSGDRLPLIGPLADAEGVYLFTGFSNPFVILPPLAQRFAHYASGHSDAIISQLSPNRFVASVAS